ncbi:hypothetical protein GCM10018793_17390 [Streptomyces sulfonofaciens]|uniref:Type ISP restriction-modification enzyme LLaBIII C-terminal specificity domain-containing protein n=1 Tax=Streptomyces sulfonofaciens TaxID=68272 RepID=A0A919FZZ0_9ACTN|nr:type ISP restriction/modification enzyme [Streptomyces sulfonofaciens]GHH75048.1 hypothetical protein GCM10018793_17390 [Streptomyces sulfonofaciens]
MPGVTHDDAPLLADLLPWSVAPLRLGRSWPLAPDAASLKARWAALVSAAEEERAALFVPSRARTVHSALAQLPGQRTGTGRLSRESGPCPEPVRVLHGPFDEQWLIPDHRLIDAARPELWRVADGHQLFAVEQGRVPGADGPAVLATALLPDGRSPAGRPGRIRPLYRRPGGREPNLAPGLLGHLAARLGRRPAPEDVLAWVLATARSGTAGHPVPLTADPDAWAHGTALGHRMLRLMARRGTERPKLPGGRRPYVRAPLPPRPAELRYDPDEEALELDEGRIAPVSPAAWDFRVSGVRVLELWLTRRIHRPQPGPLEAIGPAAWPQSWTSELLELITVLTLLARLGEELTAFAALPRAPLGAAELHAAGVLPVPEQARRPASVLDHPEEGPEGQFALI